MKFVLTICSTLLTLSSYAMSIQDALKQDLQESRTQNLSYLPSFIKEKSGNCDLLYTGKEHSDCLEMIHRHSREVLECPSSAKRFYESSEYHQWLFKVNLFENSRAELPRVIEDHFTKLISSLDTGVPYIFPFKFTLEAYQSPDKNAFAAVDGHIALSSGLWDSKDPLTIEEITAIMAHEITHVLEGHGMLINCMALEWSSYEMNISEAKAVFDEDLQSSARFVPWSQLSQRLEYAADAGAIKILHNAKMDPYSMSRALEKLAPKESGGLSSGSHPEMDQRILKAHDLAKRFN